MSSTRGSAAVARPRKRTKGAPGARRRQATVVCESTSCLPRDLVERYGIGVVPVSAVLGDRVFHDGDDVDTEAFYTRLQRTHAAAKTSPPSPGEYLAAWERAAASAPAVVLVTVSQKISTLQRSAQIAQQMVPETLPGTQIVPVDSGSAGMGQGFVALAAARAAAEGQPLEVVVGVAETTSERVRLLVTLETLEYVARASRLPEVAAFIGGLLPVKPVISLSTGEIHLAGRARTRRRSIDLLLERMHREVAPDAPLHAAVQHAHSPDEAAALEERVRSEFHCAELFTAEFTLVMGSFCGPGLLGVAFYADAADDGDDRRNDGPARRRRVA